MPTLDWFHVLAWRTQRQQLAERAPRAQALAVVADVCGLHAQLLGSAELSLWARVEGLERGAVERWLWDERTLVKTWSQRGTLHLLRSADLPRWCAAQAALKPRHETGAWLRHHGLAADEAAALIAAIPLALADGPLTREQLATAVAERTGIAGLDGKLRGGFGDLLKPAAFRGELCFAPGDGNAVRFVRPRDWLAERVDDWAGVGESDGPSPETVAAATARVARDYLARYGPAPREALARWFGTPSAAQAGRWLAALGDEAEQVEVAGEPRWILAADRPALEAAEPTGALRLLPAFDPHVIAGPRDRPEALDPDRRAAVFRPQGWISPVVVVDGRIVGTWKHERGGERLAVEIAPFAPLAGPLRTAAEGEAERLAAFLGATLDLSWA